MKFQIESSKALMCAEDGADVEAGASDESGSCPRTLRASARAFNEAAVEAAFDYEVLEDVKVGELGGIRFREQPDFAQDGRLGLLERAFRAGAPTRLGLPSSALR